MLRPWHNEVRTITINMIIMAQCNEVGDVALLRNLNIVQQLYLGGEEEEDEGQTEREEEH